MEDDKIKIDDITVKVEPLKRLDPFIGNFTEQEEWQTNFVTYVSTGYRINFNSRLLCLGSLFRIHNETVNIWTHLIGCLIGFILCLYIAIALCDPADYTVDKLLASIYDCDTTKDVPAWPLFVHAISAIILLGLSATFHTFCCCDKEHFNCL